MKIKLPLFIPLIVFTVLTVIPAHGQAPQAPAIPEAISEKGMKGELEAVYTSWRNSTVTKNYEGWKSATSQSRQINVHNEIVSQKLEFPKALFEVPVSAPDLGNLLLLEIFTRRETASAIYFGKADFGVGPAAQIAENLIVLSFLKEDNKWRFDKLSIVKMPPDSGFLGEIRVGDFSFLKSPEFQPPVGLSDLPQKISKPDYIAEIWISSVGYETSIEVNGREVGIVINNQAKQLLIGGLNRGINTVNIKTNKIKDVKLDVPDRVEIGIYAVRSIEDKPNRVFHFLPSSDAIPAQKSVNFSVSN